MRVVVLSGCNTQQRAIINSLSLIPEIELKLVRLMPTLEPAKAGSKIKRLLKNPLKFFLDKLESWNFSRREERRSKYLAEYFGAQSLANIDITDIARSAVNSPATVELIKNLRPEILVVCGAPILKQPIISLASKAAINIHFGSVPYYRGEFCIFWALARNDFDRIEVTAHQLTSALDRGAIYFQGRPEIHSTNDEFLIEARLVEFVSLYLPKLLSDFLINQVSAIPADVAEGALYRLRDRTLIHDLAFKFRSKNPRLLAAQLKAWRKFE